MKSTFLSWIGVPEGLRAKQGHHRQSSAQLYSRDDVFPQLRAQSLWWQVFAKGFARLRHNICERSRKPLIVLAVLLGSACCFAHSFVEVREP